jgi:hypothetical protein
MFWRDSSASCVVRRGVTPKGVVPCGLVRLFKESRRAAWRDSSRSRAVRRGATQLNKRSPFLPPPFLSPGPPTRLDLHGTASRCKRAHLQTLQDYPPHLYALINGSAGARQLINGFANLLNLQSHLLNSSISDEISTRCTNFL